MAASRLEAEKDNVVVPTTIEEYCIKPKKKPTEDPDIVTDFYDDDYGEDMDDFDDDADEYNDDNEDSGNGESWRKDALENYDTLRWNIHKRIITTLNSYNCLQSMSPSVYDDKFLSSSLRSLSSYKEVYKEIELRER